MWVFLDLKVCEKILIQFVFCLDYWDSYWIVQGLIQSQLFDIANATLQNFMDEIEKYGFIPNGGRIYCMHSTLILCSTHLLIFSPRPQPLSAAALHPREYHEPFRLPLICNVSDGLLIDAVRLRQRYQRHVYFGACSTAR